MQNKCKECGWDISHNAFFCENCGAEVMREILKKEILKPANRSLIWGEDFCGDIFHDLCNGNYCQCCGKKL